MLQGCSSATANNEEDEAVEKTDSIFDTSYVHEIDVQISKEDLEDLVANPLEKTKYKVNVIIDGNTVNEVSFATKGNTSLTSVASSDSDRYSFKINFSKYNKQQTYQGLKKLNLSNIYSDPTYMKDYLSYQLFDAAGALGSRASYVWLKINGEDFGLYLAIEEVDQAFLDVNTDSQGELYKPESEELENGNKPEGNDQFNPGGNNMSPPDGMQMPDGFSPFDPDGNNCFNPGNMTPPETGDSFPGGPGNGQGQFGPGNMMPGNGMGGFGGDSGASLVYTDDQLESYSDIFDNAETDVTEEDEYRVIDSLKKLSEGNVEESIDVDNTIRYFVAHNFVLNGDSYTGSMLHNYYLYENDGLLTMIPWDYNLAFGAFMMGGQNDATSLINQGIDSPLSSADESSRPMWSWIVSSDEYLEKYHAAYQEFITNYFDSGKFEKEYDRVVNMIREYVEKDPTSFYDADRFDTATKQLKQFCLLRAESIKKQLNGTLSTVTSQQNNADKVDASEINISSMGSFGGGNGGNNGFNPGGFPGNGGFGQGGFPGGGNGFNPGDSSGNGFGPDGFSGGNSGSNPWGAPDGSFNPGGPSGNDFNPGGNGGFGPGGSPPEDNGYNEGGGSREPVSDSGDIEQL